MHPSAHLSYPSYPSPGKFDHFEQLCIELLGAAWKIHFQRHGKERDGKPEYGVDAYGEDENRQLIGIQAKLRDGREGLRKSEIKDEIDRAKRFLPSLHKYVIATTASTDKDIQALAREISREHAASGLFSVTIVFWEEMDRYLQNHPEVAHRFYYIQPRDRPLSQASPSAQDRITPPADCPRFLAGKRILKLRSDMQLSAGAFVELCGIESELLLRKIEEDQADCGTSFLSRVAELTGASLDWLKYENGTPYKTEYVYVESYFEPTPQKELLELERAHEAGKIESLTVTLSAETRSVGFIYKTRGSLNYRAVLTNMRLDFYDELIPLDSQYLNSAHCFLLRLRDLMPWTWRPSEEEHISAYYGRRYPRLLAFNAFQPHRMAWRDWLQDFVTEPLDYSDSFSPDRDRRLYGEWFVTARQTLSKVPHQCKHAHAFSRRR